MKRLTFLLLVSLALPAAAGELVQLKDGTSYVGEVIELTDTHLDIEVDYPVEGRRRIERADLTDRTIWRIRSGALDLTDAKNWLALGQWAEQRGLDVPALVAYRKAARDPELAANARLRVAAMEAALAQDLFDRGEMHFVQDRPASAKNYFESLIERYPDAPSAPMARIRLEQVEERIATAKRESAQKQQANDQDAELRTKLDRWEDSVENVHALLRAAARDRPARLDPTRPVKTSRALERAVAHLERAQDLADDLGPPPEGVADDAGRKLRGTVRRRLVDAYVDTGYAYLMRPALNNAEEWASKATELDPDSEDARSLHRLIIEARMLSDYDGYFRRRPFTRR